MLRITYLNVLVAALVAWSAAARQTPAPSAQAPTPAPIERRDLALDAAAAEIGRALFLRCFCAEDDLSFDLQGRQPAGSKPRTVDWTLAGINVQKVERKGPNAIELDGVRVALRFASDRHEFERHPQKDESMRVTVADIGDPAAFERTLRAVFAIGIDRPLQKSMPDYWQHYFEPGLAWPTGSPDALTGQTIYNPGTTVPSTAGTLAPATHAGTVTAPVATHKTDANYTSYAAHDRIKGTMRLRMVVDADGNPRRTSVAVPLGYGLDAEAVKAIEKMRFSPAMLNGQPVAANVQIDQEFVLSPTPPVR